MTASELHDQLSQTCADLMIRAMGALERGQLVTTPQSDEGVTYAAKIDKAEARIDWNKPVQQVHDQIRGLSPFPGAWTPVPQEGGAPIRLKLLMANAVAGSGVPGEVLDDRLTIACGDGAISISRAQRPGKGPMNVKDLLNGLPIAAGTRLGYDA